METVLAQVQTPPAATTMMGSLYGAIRTWDASFTLTDLFGYSGHAFILNIERTLCPSGPTAWDWGAILFPLRQLFSLRRICATCDMRSPEEARELIWQRTTESLDAGSPVVLWDLLYAEFYLAYGYDAGREELLVHGPGTERVGNRVAYELLGRHTGLVWSLFPGAHESPNPAAARDLALRGAVNWHRWPNERQAQWVFGGEAWDAWIAAISLEDLTHHSVACSVNHTVYAECRRHAAAFLAAQGPAFAAAADAYTEVAEALETLCTLWPYLGPVPSAAVRRELASHLAQARDAEARGVAALELALAPAALSA